MTRESIYVESSKSSRAFLPGRPLYPVCPPSLPPCILPWRMTHVRGKFENARPQLFLFFFARTRAAIKDTHDPSRTAKSRRIFSASNAQRIHTYPTRGITYIIYARVILCYIKFSMRLCKIDSTTARTRASFERRAKELDAINESD